MVPTYHKQEQTKRCSKALKYFVTESVWPEKIAKCLSKLPKNDFTRNMILTPQKLPENVEDLGKLIVAKGFKNLPKVQ